MGSSRARKEKPIEPGTGPGGSATHPKEPAAPETGGDPRSLGGGLKGRKQLKCLVE